MAGISDEALPVVPNNYLYNGKELQQNEFSDGSGLGWYSYGMREYDPQLARFPQLDPLTDEFPTLTPYQYASNDPVANIDWDGLEGVGTVGGWARQLSKTLYAASLPGVIVTAAKPITTSAKVVKGTSLASKIVKIANDAIQLAPIAEHIINGPFVTIARQALNQVGNRYPNNGFIQFGVGWMKQGVDFLHPDVVGNLADNLRLGIKAYQQLKAGNGKGGVLSAVEATNPVVKMAVGETKLVKSAIGGNGQSQGRAAFQVATIFAGGWEGLESGTGEMATSEDATQELDGSFSIWNWEGYPTGIPKPKGPFRLLQGEEYSAARTAANKINKALAKDLEIQGKSVDIHEITPVKFNGSPTNINNKIFLDRTFHQTQVTPFWYKIMNKIP